jgi:hypothetical protein
MAQIRKYQAAAPTDINDELLQCYRNFVVLRNLCVSGRERALGDKSDNFLRHHKIPTAGLKKKDRKETIENYFDSLQQQIFDNSFVDLVATFERIIFIKIGNSSGLLRRIVKENYSAQYPFSIAIEGFIKDSNTINRLSSIQKILDGGISNYLSEQLKNIIDYRNRITHGKRFGSETTLTMKKTLEILNEILNLIG